MKKYTILFIASILVFAACKKSVAQLEEPSIAFKSISKHLVKDRDSEDTVIINLRYTMAASALGVGTEPSIVYLKDSRFDDVQTSYPFPDETIQKLPDYKKIKPGGTYEIETKPNYYTHSIFKYPANCSYG